MLDMQITQPVTSYIDCLFRVYMCNMCVSNMIDVQTQEFLCNFSFIELKNLSDFGHSGHILVEECHSLPSP